MQHNHQKSSSMKISTLTQLCTLALNVSEDGVYERFMKNMWIIFTHCVLNHPKYQPCIGTQSNVHNYMFVKWWVGSCVVWAYVPQSRLGKIFGGLLKCKSVWKPGSINQTTQISPNRLCSVLWMHLFGYIFACLYNTGQMHSGSFNFFLSLFPSPCLCLPDPVQDLPSLFPGLLPSHTQHEHVQLFSFLPQPASPHKHCSSAIV